MNSWLAKPILLTSGVLMGLIHSFIAAYIHTAHCLKSTKKVSFYSIKSMHWLLSKTIWIFALKININNLNFQKLFQFKKYFWLPNFRHLKVQNVRLWRIYKNGFDGCVTTAKIGYIFFANALFFSRANITKDGLDLVSIKRCKKHLRSHISSSPKYWATGVSFGLLLATS